jgi:hypothetical protein
MGKKFKSLKRALRSLRSPTATEGSVTPDAPSDTILREYQLYAADKKQITYPREASSLPGNEKAISLKPFALPPTSTTEVEATISSRSLANLSLFGLSKDKLGFTDPRSTTALESTGFKPAKAICRNVTGTTGVPTPSKITGEKYSKKPNASYTFPIGRTTANASWHEQRAAILAQVAGAGGNKSVSFKVEVY